MKKSTIIIIAVVAILIFVIGGAISTYNNLVNQEERVENRYANLDTMLQRRADLIPNLVSTTKGYMNHETEIIQSITQARENLVNANTLEDKEKANGELSKQLSAFLVVVENYPELTSSQNFINLSDEIAGTENRIATARRDYNEAVGAYNASIRQFPNSIFAGMFGFEKAKYFEADESSTQVPTVSFED